MNISRIYVKLNILGVIIALFFLSGLYLIWIADNQKNENISSIDLLQKDYNKLLTNMSISSEKIIGLILLEENNIREDEDTKIQNYTELKIDLITIYYDILYQASFLKSLLLQFVSTKNQDNQVNLKRNYIDQAKQRIGHSMIDIDDLLITKEFKNIRDMIEKSNSNLKYNFSKLKEKIDLLPENRKEKHEFSALNTFIAILGLLFFFIVTAIFIFLINKNCYEMKNLAKEAVIQLNNISNESGSIKENFIRDSETYNSVVSNIEKLYKINAKIDTFITSNKNVDLEKIRPLKTMMLEAQNIFRDLEHIRTNKLYNIIPNISDYKSQICELCKTIDEVVEDMNKIANKL